MISESLTSFTIIHVMYRLNCEIRHPSTVLWIVLSSRWESLHGRGNETVLRETTTSHLTSSGVQGSNQQFHYWFRRYFLGLKTMAPVVTSQLMARSNVTSLYTDLWSQAYLDTHSHLGSQYIAVRLYAHEFNWIYAKKSVFQEFRTVIC
jgi:hypothetical protein